MARPLLLTLIAALLTTGLLLLQGRHDSRLPENMDYLLFNRSRQADAKAIMTAWRQKPEYIAAVKKIVLTDLVFIVVYTSYLLWALSARRKVVRHGTPGPGLVRLLSAGIACLVLGVLIDLVQDSLIYLFVTRKEYDVFSLHLLTWVKWRLLLLAVGILLFSLVPSAWLKKERINRVILYLAAILKSIWLFFPSILFIFLTIFCFWIEGQGKDILVAFTEPDRRGFRIFFFVAVGFWVYVTWYSSRVIGYIKLRRRPFLSAFLYNYPRLGGNACFLVLELAVLQAPILRNPLCVPLATAIFFAGLIGLYLLDKKLRTPLQRIAAAIGGRFRFLALGFLLIVAVTAVIRTSRIGYLYCLFGLLVLFQVFYLLYINLHRVMVGEANHYLKREEAHGFSEKLMAFFCIPKEEKSFFHWLVGTSVVAILIDWAAIWCLDFAREIGPLSIVLLGFAVLLAFGNVTTALSVRLNLNVHFLLILMALLIGTGETHRVRQQPVLNAKKSYDRRPGLSQYLRTWLKRLPDSPATYDMYFVLSNGGASRSGYWTASVLGALEDTTRKICADTPFSRQLFCLSGTSGGGVGVATFFGLLNDHRDSLLSYRESGAAFLKEDYFTYTVARMLGPDYFNYIFRLTSDKDRGAALEEGFEAYKDNSKYRPLFDRPFSQFLAMNTDYSEISLPILFVNTTRMQDGNPGVVTNLKPDAKYFSRRIDVLNLLDSDKDISLASGAILGARFPYLSPAGRIGDNYFVDGGYFDNSGAGVVQELLRGIMTIAWDDSLHGDRWIYQRVKRLHIKVLHIMNSPIAGVNKFAAVPPIKNDLLSPVQTIIGAYGMQTTVNDARLYNYLEDINTYFHVPTQRYRISLYEDDREWKADPLYTPGKTEPEYSMNWFISDTTRLRIDGRLQKDTVLKRVIREFTPSICK